MWRTPLAIRQRIQERSGSILVIATSPVVWVVSTKLCTILEGHQRDSAIHLITLLMESGIGVPMNLGIVEGSKSLESKTSEVNGLPLISFPSNLTDTTHLPLTVGVNDRV